MNDSSVLPLYTGSDPRVSHELALLRTLSIGALHGRLPGELAWARSLDQEECLEMQQELVNALETAVATGDWSAYDEAIEAWRATADVLSNPDLTARLLSESDPVEEVPLRRP